MTFLAYLGYLQQNVAQGKPGSDRQGRKIDSFRQQVLPEITRADICALVPHPLGALVREQADLTMPVSGVGITLDAVVDLDVRSLHWRFLNAGFRGYAYVQDSGDHRSGFLVIRPFLPRLS